MEEALHNLQEFKNEYTHMEHSLLTNGTANRASSSLEAFVDLNDKLRHARIKLAEQYERKFQVQM